MINWYQIPHFEPKEFSENPDHFANPSVIYALQTFRSKLGWPIYPSPVEGALARFNGDTGTQHYVGPIHAPIRKSTAVDVFAEGMPAANLLILMTIQEIKGIGVYLDTTGPDGMPWVMFHIDTRSGNLPLIWICEKRWSVSKQKIINVYQYPQTFPAYWTRLQHENMYHIKQYGKPGFKPKG